MVPAGNKAKLFSSVNHTTKKNHHHYHTITHKLTTKWFSNKSCFFFYFKNLFHDLKSHVLTSTWVIQVVKKQFG